MDKRQLENLTKAHHDAQFLVEDLRAVHAWAEDPAWQEMMLGFIDQAAKMSAVLGQMEKHAERLLQSGQDV